MVVSAGGTPPARPQVRALNCPHCGAALTLRSFGNAVTVVCESCHSILDAKDANLQILQQFKASEDEKPLIPLGTRGKIRGIEYEVIGFQRRTIHVDGVPYSWHEYVLFNPYKGFRYLTEYNGHWNDCSTLKALPEILPYSPPKVRYLGETYKHFQTAKAGTSFVLGEFPWQVRVGETAVVTDYVSPPRVLSSEQTGQEVTWSMGEYMSGKDVWKAFHLPGDPPEAVGVYENQPSPVSSEAATIWAAFAAFLLLLVLTMSAFDLSAGKAQVFTGYFKFNSNQRGDSSFVTDEFEIRGHTSNVEVDTSTDLNNRWIYLNYALINEDTGQAFDFGREVSYYHGYDSDGSWSEGNANDSVAVPKVPPGRYYLRVEPEGDPGYGVTYYTVTIRRDVPQYSLYALAFGALLLPAIVVTWRSLSFEHLRWAESDHPPISLNVGDDE
ncbi:MAG TPA: DUF4178 domain-containing protein [Terriglobales bacterium]|nr:DUF4178 domain-containing protein [Terriglobales bacterium]